MDAIPEEIMGTQFGDYVLTVIKPSREFGGCECAVRMAGGTEYLSFHQTQTAAKAAIKRYQAGDKRRRS